MFFNFIDELREAGIKASFKEHLMLTGNDLYGSRMHWKANAQPDSARPSSARQTSASVVKFKPRTLQTRCASILP